MAQIVDADGFFIPQVHTWLDSEGFRNRGFDFSVTTVLGCQSSGKSTLLNALFGTKFPVMNSQLGRQQTTKGAWIATSKNTTTPMVIIDVEGTDSRERGEDRMTFEHRAALFSLALADVVVVNMWYHDLGRYTASNYGILKTVLAVNLDLFQQDSDCPKTVLLFVIRDYSKAQTPIERLHAMIYTDIASIWKEITKPSHLNMSVADDFFHIRLVGLPSAFANPSGFAKAVTKLRARWETELSPPTYSRKVPADGFAHYAQSVWEAILRQSELDIPSQKEMLASYRCEEIKNSVLAQITAPVAEKHEEAQAGVLLDFPRWADTLTTDCLTAYDATASRYQTKIFIAKRVQLVQAICATLQKVVDAHLTQLRRKMHEAAALELTGRLTTVQRDPSDIVSEEGRCSMWTNFTMICMQWKDGVLARFNEEAQGVNALNLSPELRVLLRKQERIHQLAVSCVEFRETSIITAPKRQKSDSQIRTCSTDATEALEEREDVFLSNSEINNEDSEGGYLDNTPLQLFNTSEASNAFGETLDGILLREKERQLNELQRYVASTAAAVFKGLETSIVDTGIDVSKFWTIVTETTLNGYEQASENLMKPWLGLEGVANILTASG
eukprot:Lankesteria_metandrocarpae@DN5146_c0_g2_i1.p1